MRIHLVRHGRSSLVHDGRWFAAPDVGRYEDAYDAQGIHDESHPPTELVEVASRADVVVSSDMTRAIASARRLAPGREPEIVPHLRELRLEPPAWVPLKLPIEAWDAMSYAQWTYRIALGVDHEIARRAGVAADWLVERAGKGATIVAVTHGGIRRIIDRHLERRGARPVSDRRSHANWSCWTYQLR